MKIMASSPIISWQIDGKTMETVTDFIFLGSKITADGDCSHEIKRCLLLGKKAITNLDSTLKSRDITLPLKVCLVKAMVFPVVMYGCESWSVVSNSLRRHGLYSPWNSPGQKPGVGSLSFLQGIFPTQGSNPGLPHCKRILYCLSHQASNSQPKWLKECRHTNRTKRN